jgi:hypothetical protein
VIDVVREAAPTGWTFFHRLARPKRGLLSARGRLRLVDLSPAVKKTAGPTKSKSIETATRFDFSHYAAAKQVIDHNDLTGCEAPGMILRNAIIRALAATDAVRLTD